MSTSTTNGRDDSTTTSPTPSQQRPPNGLLEEEDLLPLPESLASTLNNIVWPAWRKYLRHHTSDRVMAMTCIEEWSERARNLCFVAKGRMGQGNHESGLLLDQLCDMVGDLEQIQEFGELTIGYDEAVRRAVDKARSGEENGSGAEAERPGAADTIECDEKGKSAHDCDVSTERRIPAPQEMSKRFPALGLLISPNREGYWEDDSLAYDLVSGVFTRLNATVELYNHLCDDLNDERAFAVFYALEEQVKLLEEVMYALRSVYKDEKKVKEQDAPLQ